MLWIPVYAGMTECWDCLSITLAFDSSPIKGEGDSGGCVGLMMPSVLVLCEVRLFHLLIRSTSRASCLAAGL